MDGRPDAAAAAERVVALETRLARAQWTEVELRDPIKGYNPMDLAAATKAHAGHSTGKAGSRPQVCRTRRGWSSGQPSYVKQVAAAVRDVPLATWKDYLRVRVIDDYAPYLMGGKFAEAAFDFHERTLTGVPGDAAALEARHRSRSSS